jgi:CheY-like chemotaxis protein
MRDAVPLTEIPVSVLFIGDRSSVCGDLSTALEFPAVTLVEVRSAAEAARAVAGRPFALALLCASSGGPDAAATLRTCREDEHLSQLPLIVLADARAPTLSADEAYCLGAVDYLVHPVSSAILRTKVAGLVEGRRRAEASLRQSAREAARLLTVLAHDLRNELAPVQTFAGELEENGQSAVRERARRIARHVRRCASSIGDALEVAALRSGETSLHFERLDLARMVRGIAEARRALLTHAGMELDVATPTTPLWVNGDRLRIEQALDKLLDEAIRVSRSGKWLDFTVRSDPPSAIVVVRVRDSGRTHPVDGQRSPALPIRTEALGLALARAVIERLGGTLAVSESASEFTATLPTAGEPPALSAAPEDAAAPAGRRRVLVVEDNRDAATSLSVLLGLMGHDVRVAYTGPEGVAAAAEWPPEIIISDIGLPGFDGFEVARRLRCQLGSKPLLVALTGYGRDEDRRRSREAGFDHHLVKPADPVVIQRMVATAR